VVEAVIVVGTLALAIVTHGNDTRRHGWRMSNVARVIAESLALDDSELSAQHAWGTMCVVDGNAASRQIFTQAVTVHVWERSDGCAHQHRIVSREMARLDRRRYPG
jgi:hypothetical protein